MMIMTHEEQKQLALDALDAYLVRKQEQEKLDGEIEKLHKLADLKKYYNKFKNIFESLELDEENACYKLCGHEFHLFQGRFNFDKYDEPEMITPVRANGWYPVSDLASLGQFLRNQDKPKVVPAQTVTIDIPNGFTDVEIRALVKLLAR